MAGAWTHSSVSLVVKLAVVHAFLLPGLRYQALATNDSMSFTQFSLGVASSRSVDPQLVVDPLQSACSYCRRRNRGHINQPI